MRLIKRDNGRWMALFTVACTRDAQRDKLKQRKGNKTMMLGT